MIQQIGHALVVHSEFVEDDAEGSHLAVAGTHRSGMIPSGGCIEPGGTSSICNVHDPP
ncbi:hypothetical protein [Naasia sp. SYSU D00948]|uniref:hypothetical protein n=1 Tax=Naasia sp. SYSU D00948 TaxID=2817379 RepID=UPI001B308ACC|nr:hypothetical protein [Naasia sp. SYSU D00948]